MVIQHCRQQIVGRADGVEVSGKMEVDILHGHHLGVAAAGRAALDPKHRAQRGLPQGHHGILADLAQAVSQAHGGGGLALAGRRRGDGCDQDQLPVGTIHLLQHLIVYLGFVVAVELQILFIHADLLGDLADILHLTRLGDLDIGLHEVISLIQFIVCKTGLCRSRTEARQSNYGLPAVERRVTS